uniref:CCHC-type domain-containing protein n=1 Tax=Magallana gigas TaxID=29159 RepID=A0A8W8LP91_MAGGI
MRDFKVYERRSPNAIQIICNVSTNFFYLSVECITNCIYNTHCNAIDVSGTYCRLIRGGDSLYTEQNVATTCQRFQIDALQQAKLGEAYGYRSLSATAPMVAAVQPAESNTNQDHNQHLFSMLRDISHRLEKLEAPTSRPRTGRDRDLSTCHACGGAGHLKRSCNWTGHGSPKSQAKCQICFQTGHTAAECRPFATKKTVRNSEQK